MNTITRGVPDFQQLPHTLLPLKTEPRLFNKETADGGNTTIPNFQHVDETSKSSSTEFHKFPAGWSSGRLKGRSQQLREPGLGRGPPISRRQVRAGGEEETRRLMRPPCPQSTEMPCLPPHARAWKVLLVAKHGFRWVGSK